MSNLNTGNSNNSNGQAIAANSVTATATSSKNALRHGVYANEIVLSSESAEDFETLHASLCRELNPDGELEDDVLVEIAQAHWLKRRLVRCYRSSCEDAPIASERAVAEKKNSACIDQQAQASPGGGSSSGALFRGNWKQQDRFRKVLKMLLKADGLEQDQLALSPSAKELMELTREISEPTDGNDSAFDRICRPSDLERFLKILGTLDTRIEKAMSRLIAFKEYKRQYGKNVLQA